MPPNGGFGGNTGVQDAHNLAWKLALVLRGQAGPELLSTYEQERRPAAAFTAEQAYTRYVTRVAPYLAPGGMQPLAPDLNIELGYCYHSPAVISEDPADTRGHESPRESRGRPGTRAPHVYLNRAGERVSTLDLYGRNFVLLAGPEGDTWREYARDAALHEGIHLDVHQAGGAKELADPGGGFCEAHGIAPSGCLLVRPDGFVGWRARTSEDASAERLRGALASLRCL